MDSTSGENGPALQCGKRASLVIITHITISFLTIITITITFTVAITITMISIVTIEILIPGGVAARPGRDEQALGPWGFRLGANLEIFVILVVIIIVARIVVIIFVITGTFRRIVAICSNKAQAKSFEDQDAVPLGCWMKDLGEM